MVLRTIRIYFDLYDKHENPLGNVMKDRWLYLSTWRDQVLLVLVNTSKKHHYTYYHIIAGNSVLELPAIF